MVTWCIIVLKSKRLEINYKNKTIAREREIKNVSYKKILLDSKEITTDLLNSNKRLPTNLIQTAICKRNTKTSLVIQWV